MSGDHFADSWIDCKGTNVTISNNIGIFSVKDGFQVRIKNEINHNLYLYLL